MHGKFFVLRYTHHHMMNIFMACASAWIGSIEIAHVAVFDHVRAGTILGTRLFFVMIFFSSTHGLFLEQYATRDNEMSVRNVLSHWDYPESTYLPAFCRGISRIRLFLQLYHVFRFTGQPSPHAPRRDEICSARNARKLSRTQISLPLFSNQNDEADSATPWPFAFVCRFGNETTTTVDIMETIRTRERTPISHHGRQVTSFACEFDEFLRALARKTRSFYFEYLSNLYCRLWRRFAVII